MPVQSSDSGIAVGSTGFEGWRGNISNEGLDRKMMMHVNADLDSSEVALAESTLDGIAGLGFFVGFR